MSNSLGFLYRTRSVCHTAMFKMDNQQGPIVQHRELYSMLYASLDGREFSGRIDTYICMAESLHCSLETITTLLISYTPIQNRASLVAQMIKNLPTMQETRVRSLGQEDPLEKGMATHSSILAWRIPWTEAPGRLQSKRSQRAGHD